MSSTKKVAIGILAGYAIAVTTSAILPEFISVALPIAGGYAIFALQSKRKGNGELTHNHAPALPSLSKETEAKLVILKQKVGLLNSEFLKKTEEVEVLLSKVLEFVETAGSLKLQYEVKSGLSDLISVVDAFLEIEDEMIKLQNWRSVMKKGYNPYIEKLRFINENKNKHSLQDLQVQLEGITRKYQNIG